MSDELFPAEAVRAIDPDAVQRLSKKQRAILESIKLNGQITLEMAVHLVGSNVYHNAAKHTGALLANMVKRGLIKRTSPGTFTTP